MLTLEKVVAGIGSAGANCYKDIYKASRNCMTDRAMTVRSAASKVQCTSVIRHALSPRTRLKESRQVCGDN